MRWSFLALVAEGGVSWGERVGGGWGVRDGGWGTVGREDRIGCSGAWEGGVL